MKLDIFQVDAFSQSVFGGNPAAVCPLTEWLSDEQLRRKREAIGAHLSQLEKDPSTGAPAVLNPQTLERLLQPFELVFL